LFSNRPPFRGNEDFDQGGGNLNASVFVVENAFMDHQLDRKEIYRELIN